MASIRPERGRFNRAQKERVFTDLALAIELGPPESRHLARRSARLKISSACAKQYHFRPSKQGLLAWDVDRLIALSERLPLRLISLSAIRGLDEAYWFSHEGDTPTCRAILEHMKLIQEVDLRYPVILCSQGRVMDGMHRIARAVLEGRSDIEARQFDLDPEPDYVDADPGALPYVRAP